MANYIPILSHICQLGCASNKQDLNVTNSTKASKGLNELNIIFIPEKNL